MYIKGLWYYDSHPLIAHRKTFKKFGSHLFRVQQIVSLDVLARTAVKQFGSSTTLGELLKKPELCDLSAKVPATPEEVTQYLKAEARLMRDVEKRRVTARRTAASAIAYKIKQAARIFTQYGIAVPRDLTPAKLPKGISLEDFPKPASKEKKKA